MAKDIKRIRSFRHREEYIDRVLAQFEKAGFSIEFVYDNEPDVRSWGAMLRPGDDLAQELGSRTEMLLWVDYYDVFQPRSLQRIRDVFTEARPRLREDVVFFVSQDSKVSDAISSLPSDTTVVPFSSEQLRAFAAPAGPDFRRHILSGVFARDPYRWTGAVTQHWQFFGRSNLLTELITAASNGERIGLFGLRKIGKTSLLLRLIEQLRLVNPHLIIAHLQVARVDAIRRTAEYFLWSLGQSILLAMPKTGRRLTFRLFGRYGVFGDLSPSDLDQLPDLFVHDIGVILARDSFRLCLVLDEIERMWPAASDPSTSQWLSEFPRVWQLLRSLDQEYPNKVSFVVAGTNPQCVEESRIGTRENPLFQYMQIRYLSFFDREDAYLLLKDLGTRGGLHWREEACKIAYDQVGGHPALLRVLGSVVYREGRSHDRRRVLSESNVAEVTAATRRESSPILNEICGALQEGYPDDFLLLECLAQNRIGEFKQYSEAFPDAVQHLIGFGLVLSKPGPSISFSLLQNHIQISRREKSLATSDSLLPTEIANYRITSSLGRAGGFGRVFKAVSPLGGQVAIKLLHSGSLAALSREVDILKELRHENIVRFIDSGRESAGNYIIMEYLEGTLWSSYCSRATRLNARDAKFELIKLLKALQYIHPKVANIDELTTELSLQEVLSRSIGYIHRDIKPENIVAVPRRGPVLIDFGIASKAGDPTKTTSATPGYLPPDFVFGRWDADIDLFQLGVTFLQALIGEQYTGALSQLEDLRTVLQNDESVPKQLKQIVLKLCETERSNRFGSAAEVLATIGV